MKHLQTPSTHQFLAVLLSVTALYTGTAMAQDTRQVKEPQAPPVCTVLSAQEDLPGNEQAYARAPDTGRLQAALGLCKPGQALRLISKNGKTAFIAGALNLPDGVSLLIDAGVTVFASTNPQDYDKGSGACGSNDDKGRACKPFITADHTQSSGIYGEGVIDGQGGQRIQGKLESWWQIARRAQKENSRQNVPRLLEVTQSRDFTLHRVTLKNSPNFHVTLNQVDGFTAWGVRIDTPADARNTDGIDPISSRNVTIAHSYIRTGDDNVAIKAGNNGPTENITVRDSHFYSGHGMSIGSETNGGLKNILVENLSMDGTTSGLRIKSDISRGGLVQNVSYRNVCIRNVRAPIDIDTRYTKNATGDLIPVYRDIRLEHVQSLTPGRITLRAYDAAHPISLRLQDVVVSAGGAREIAHVQLLSTKADDGTDGNQDVMTGFAREPLNASQCGQAFPAFPSIAQLPGKRPQLDAATAQMFSYTEVLKYAGVPGEEKPDPWDPLSDSIATQAGLQADYVVDASASEDGVRSFKKLQAAVSKAVYDQEKTPGKKSRIHIQVKPGIYRELVYIPATGTAITVYGSDAANTRITANLDAAVTGSSYVRQFSAQFEKVHPSISAMYDSLKDRPVLGTFGTAVLWVKSPGFQLKNISVENAFNKDTGNAREPAEPSIAPVVHHQALAVMLDGADKTHFEGVRLLGFQDTLFLKNGRNAETARYFFNRSYIEGDVDFIFGDATAFFYHSEIKSLGDRTTSYAAAPNTNIRSRYGFVFDHSRFTHDGSQNAKAGKFYLLRQWFHNSRCTPYGSMAVAGYSCQVGENDQYVAPSGTITRKALETVGKMVVMNSAIGSHINKSQPWSDWNRSGTLSYRPAQFNADEYWTNLLAAKIDPIRQLGYSGPFDKNRIPDSIFLAEFNNTDE